MLCKARRPGRFPESTHASISDQVAMEGASTAVQDAMVEEDAFTLVTNASVTAASEIREELADCLRRLDLINLSMPGIYLSQAIDSLDDDIQRIAGAMEISELG